MPWIVGIDEAGYGPNLGPLVQACVAMQLPDDDSEGWVSLKQIVRKAHEPHDGRLVVDDSKKVYHGTNGLRDLERTAAQLVNRSGTVEFGQFLYSVSRLNWLEKLCQEVWFDNKLMIFNDCRSEKTLPQCHVMLRITPAVEFNRVVAKHGSKSFVVQRGIIDFLSEQQNVYLDVLELKYTCDKLGGRNFYGPILQEAFPEGWPVAEIESAAESRYRILNVGREITVTFKPKADGENVCVALASMLAKYVREICMRQFNEFWAKHVPGIRPTAGYPVDAKRFYSEIQEAMIRLGIPADAVWRKK